MHLELLLEEPSAEEFLKGMLPKILKPSWSWKLIVFQGKMDLLANLHSLLLAYAKWITEEYRIAVLIDKDREDCNKLKEQLDAAARKAGLTSKSEANGGKFVVLNRIAVEELEAWYFGDTGALCRAFSRVSTTLGKKAKYRDPDAIAGGTWESLERELKRARYYETGLSKIDLARKMAAQMSPDGNTSKSFNHFVAGLRAFEIGPESE